MKRHLIAPPAIALALALAAPAGAVRSLFVARTVVEPARPGLAVTECHAGTWRESLGPSIGDSLAVARTKLHFVRKP